uniref:Uncharacterized protein n=1 Tax=Triticum urartu TaxID=4572 RepID=A0A8R7JW46_TRIUA
QISPCPTPERICRRHKHRTSACAPNHPIAVASHPPHPRPLSQLPHRRRPPSAPSTADVAPSTPQQRRRAPNGHGPPPALTDSVAEPLHRRPPSSAERLPTLHRKIHLSSRRPPRKLHPSSKPVATTPSAVPPRSEIERWKRVQHKERG